MKQATQASQARGRARRSRRSPAESGGSEFPALVKSALLGTAIALGGALALLLLGARLCLQAENPLALARPVGTALLYLCAAAAGLLTAKRQKKQALLCGLTAGVLVAVFFWALTLLLRDEGETALSLSASLLLRALLLPVSCLGAFLGVKKKAPRRRRR